MLLLWLVSLTLFSCGSMGPAPFDEQPSWDISRISERTTLEGVLDRRCRIGDAMYAAREILLSGPPFYAKFDELDFEKTLLEETTLTRYAPWYARYNVEAALLSSGAGIHLMHGPTLRRAPMNMAESWKSPQDALEARLEIFRKRAGLETSLMTNMFPLFLEFDSADPFYTQAPDFGNAGEGIPPDGSSLLWDPKTIDQTLSPRTLGMTLHANVDFASYYFRSTRLKEDQAARPYLGATPEEGYLGAILMEAAASKLFTLATQFAYNPLTGYLGPMQLDGYDPEFELLFFPSKIRPIFTDLEISGEVSPPKPAEIFLPVDEEPKSTLTDQVSLLLGLCAFIEASDPEGELASQGVFGYAEAGGPLFPVEYHGLARALARCVVKNIDSMHYHEDWQTFVSYAIPGEKGNIVHTEDITQLVIAFERYADLLLDGDPLRDRVLELFEAQVGYVLGAQRFDGMYPRTMIAQSAFTTFPVVWPLEVQSLAIQALLAGYRVLKHPDYKMAALRTYDYVEENLWAIDYQLYRSEEVTNSGTKYSIYTPFAYGTTLGALRSLASATCDSRFGQKVREYIDGLPKSKLLLSELDPTEDQVFAGGKKMDPDGDGIPYAPMACPPFGAAPVFVSKTIVRIP